MSFTIEGEVVKPTEYSQKLRSELKEWEKAFAAANNGRKAGRDELKQYPEIASKYKEYAHLRPPIPTRVLPSQAPPLPTTKKRKHTPAHPFPTRPQPHHLSTLDPYDSPRSVHRTPSPLRTSIGPTPQKNGTVLGLFDLLSRSRSHEKWLTPSQHPLEQTTPSRTGRGLGSGGAGIGAEAEASGGRHKRTPQSSSKRVWLDSFLTPSARRVVDKDGARTPRGSVSELVFDETPEFLRRGSRRVDSMAPFEALENDDDAEAVGGDVAGDEAFSWSPVAVRMPRKAAGRGLSVLVRGLRGLEEEMWDEEMEVLREVEGTKTKGAAVVVVDSQGGEMPLGADGEGESEDEDGQAGKGRHGRPVMWKKKGQKRSTRRVVMKPVAGKWKPEPEWKAPRNDSEDDVVVETQVVDAGATLPDGEEGHDTGDGYAGTAENAADSQATVVKQDGLVEATVKAKKAPRKISSTAHANYRALKIKNKHSKGKGGGKFGRRR